MQFVKLSLLSAVMCLAAIGCRGTAQQGRLTDAEQIEVAPREQNFGAGGTITVYVIPPAKSLNWDSPNALSRASLASKLKGELDKKLGRVTLPHPIGHLHVKMECDGVSIPLTGQTGSGSEYASAFDGMGASFRIFPGYLDDPEVANADFQARLKSGKIAGMRFKIDGRMCHHMKGFIDEYQQRDAHKKYGGQFRPRRFEGSGCSAFGLAFIELGGFMRRSLYTKDWARNINIGIARISDVAGQGFFKYGSNLISYDDQGNMVQWPKDKDIVVQQTPTKPLVSSWLDQWTDERDPDYNLDPEKQPSVVPWTIYDPELIFNFIQDVHAKGGGEALERQWIATKEGNANIIESDATNAVPQPWEDPEDDLRKD